MFGVVSVAVLGMVIGICGVVMGTKEIRQRPETKRGKDAIIKVRPGKIVKI